MCIIVILHLNRLHNAIEASLSAINAHIVIFIHHLDVAIFHRPCTLLFILSSIIRVTHHSLVPQLLDVHSRASHSRRRLNDCRIRWFITSL